MKSLVVVRRGGSSITKRMGMERMTRAVYPHQIIPKMKAYPTHHYPTPNNVLYIAHRWYGDTRAGHTLVRSLHHSDDRPYECRCRSLSIAVFDSPRKA